ncbi:hypothetical protein [Salinicoccus halodurans]|uniref:Uncharacterized protein n=1 Tax=Salinicoccus halodurans TaxID=407035 RepID=A0A0F7HIR8_9STAP|nr:hypothetical protein [Salinicoccus halodurans]AKG73402.1 hypothetical protein AAT16_03705 [Salinicoccus halodurans]SFK81288.1 hypothetical protein SAMN05216235_1779 [Salinicoccus halodurans]
MSRLIKVTDLDSRDTRHILEVDAPDTFKRDLEAALSEEGQIHIDVDVLRDTEIVQIAQEIPPENRDRVQLIFSPEILTEALIDRLEVSDIAVEAGKFILTPGEKNAAAGARFRTLRHNMKLKNKTYEMEIIESLLTDASAETQKYQELKSRYDNLKAAASVKQDADLEERYLNVMDKYKQALERLDRLRKSKLGRLQMAYWNRKGKH